MNLKLNRGSFLGPILIVLGIFIALKGDGPLFGTGDIFAYFWPSLFLLPLGIFFHWLYFSVLGRNGAGLLVPGGILLTSAIVCQISMLFDLWSIMWPGFILSVAIGLGELYLFGNRNKWLLIPINILAVLSFMFFAVFAVGSFFGGQMYSQPAIAIALIAVGAVMLLRGKKTTF